MMAHRKVSTLKWLLRYSRRHWRPFAAGCLAAVAVVALRLALPWPLKALLDPLLSGTNPPVTTSPIVWALVFLVIVLLLGMADAAERLAFGRYAKKLVRDLRGDAHAAATKRPEMASNGGHGDLIVRLISDCARVKSGLTGFLVHVATNGLLFVGVGAVFLWVYLPVGLVFLGASAILVVLTAIGAVRIHARAAASRNTESKFAKRIVAFDGDAASSKVMKDLGGKVGETDAAITRIQVMTTWAAHAIFGVLVLASIWLAWTAVESGRLEPSSLVLLSMYVLVARAPAIQIARQGTRIGKILASADRVCELLDLDSTAADSGPALEPLTAQAQLCGIKVSSGARRLRRRRLGTIDLMIAAGEHILVIGGRGAGKTTLLRVLAGLEPRMKGHVRWNDRVLTPANLNRAGPEIIGYLPEVPTWAPTPLREFLSQTTPGDQDPDAVDRALRASGAHRLVQRISGGPDGMVAANEVSLGERKALALARLLRHRPSLILLDEPGSARKPGRDAALVRSILKCVPAATIVLASSRPVEVRRFDRVVELRRGKVRYDGPADQWLLRDSGSVSTHHNKKPVNGAGSPVGDSEAITWTQ